MYIFLSYLAVLVPLVVIDGLWILYLAKDFYADKMGFLFQESANLTPVVFFYPIYALAVLLLAVMPAVSSSSWVEALWRGALLGLAAYGAYDLTNHATIANWPLSMTLTDILWGVFLTSSVSVIAFLVLK